MTNPTENLLDRGPIATDPYDVNDVPLVSQDFQVRISDPVGPYSFVW